MDMKRKANNDNNSSASLPKRSRRKSPLRPRPELPEEKPSATANKFRHFKYDPTKARTGDDGGPSGFRIVHFEFIKALLSDRSCSNCGDNRVSVTKAEKPRGLFSNIIVQCLKTISQLTWQTEFNQSERKTMLPHTDSHFNHILYIHFTACNKCKYLNTCE